MCGGCIRTRRRPRAGIAFVVANASIASSYLNRKDAISLERPRDRGPIARLGIFGFLSTSSAMAAASARRAFLGCASFFDDGVYGMIFAPLSGRCYSHTQIAMKLWPISRFTIDIDRYVGSHRGQRPRASKISWQPNRPARDGGARDLGTVPDEKADFRRRHRLCPCRAFRFQGDDVPLSPPSTAVISSIRGACIAATMRTRSEEATAENFYPG